MSAITDEAVEAAALAMFADEHCDKRQMLDVRGNWDARLNDEDQALYRSMARAALEVAQPFMQPQVVASRERVAEVLYRAGQEWTGENGDIEPHLADALLSADVFREPQPECGAVDRTGERRCVFTPGHHEVEDWTSHGDRGGWTWNDQPAED